MLEVTIGSTTCGRTGRRDGFSMVELMIVLAISSILLTMVVPGFAALLGKMRVSTAANDFLAAARATRSEALGRGVRVDMVPNDGASWSSGWTVFVDANDDQVPDEGETVIHRREHLANDVEIDGGEKGKAFFEKGAKKTYLAFNGAGYPKRNGGASAMDSLMLHNSHSKRKAIVSFLGRVSSCNPDTDKSC